MCVLSGGRIGPPFTKIVHYCPFSTNRYQWSFRSNQAWSGVAMPFLLSFPSKEVLRERRRQLANIRNSEEVMIAGS